MGGYNHQRLCTSTEIDGINNTFQRRLGAAHTSKGRNLQAFTGEDARVQRYLRILNENAL